ncbi:MAG: HAMP domain-containing sensor histidine kinase [Campylobacterota bacterium]|nr:HAMP domain-containing sensor histidine kinase [Campylobacterota bacterium]
MIILQIGAKTKSLDSDEIYNESKKIADIAQHLSDTINDFRDFFKPNKSKVKTSFSLLIEDVLKILSNSIDTKNIRLVQELNSTKEFETYANEIKQVILNLIINAEDAIADKSITNGYIKIYSYDENEKSILEISDNAGGVPSEIIEMIFDPYFSTKLEKNGTGLGLYMSKTIVNEHCNGTLEVLNKDGGATFRITL